MLEINKTHNLDVLEGLRQVDDTSIDLCVTSPPYFGLRDYKTVTWHGVDPLCSHEIPDNERDPKNPNAGSHISRFNREFCYKCGAKRIDKQIGLEKTPEEYVAKLVEVFREVRRVLKPEGTLFLNLGDSYWGSGNASGHTDNTTNCGATTSEYGATKGHTVQKHNTLKPKDLIGIPWRVAFALQSDEWYLRQDIIWHKPNPMPESVTDRCTKSHEYIFLLSKNQKYYFDQDAILEPANYDGRKDTMMKGSTKYRNGEHLANGNANSLSIKGRERWRYKNLQEDGQPPHTMHEKRLYGEEYMSPVRNKRSVWVVNTQPFSEAHFAVFPPSLIEPMIKAGCPQNGIVLDPFMGSGTTGAVAKSLCRNYIGLELNPNYCSIADKRTYKVQGADEGLKRWVRA